LDRIQKIWDPIEEEEYFYDPETGMTGWYEEELVEQLIQKLTEAWTIEHEESMEEGKLKDAAASLSGNVSFRIVDDVQDLFTGFSPKYSGRSLETTETQEETRSSSSTPGQPSKTAPLSKQMSGADLLQKVENETRAMQALVALTYRVIACTFTQNRQNQHYVVDKPMPIFNGDGDLLLSAQSYQQALTSRKSGMDFIISQTVYGSYVRIKTVNMGPTECFALLVQSNLELLKKHINKTTVSKKLSSLLYPVVTKCGPSWFCSGHDFC
jgi:hypothetical protein